MNLIEQIARLERKFQIFVSSPYQGLQEERGAAIKAILDSECIPVGMEMFPPTSEETFGYIKKVIDQSDFYFVMLGASYGSVHPKHGISYTELEYNYALKTKKPIVALVSSDAHTFLNQMDSEIAKKYKRFHDKLRKNRIAPIFSNPLELRIEIMKALRELRKEAAADSGFVRAQEITDILADFEGLDEESKAEYLETIEALSMLNLDEELWSYVHDIFHNLRDATHALIYDPEPEDGRLRGDHLPFLHNVCVSFRNFVQEILEVKVHVTIKDLTVGARSTKTATIASTEGTLSSRQKAYPLKNFAGLSELYEKPDDTDLCIYREDDIAEAIKEGRFRKGSQKAPEDYQKRRRRPIRSTLCAPIQKIDHRDGKHTICRGFICLESPVPDAFAHDSVVWMLCAVADALYILMTTRDLARRKKGQLSTLRKMLEA